MNCYKNICLVLFTVFSAFANHAELLFDKGLKAANQKEYKEAIFHFEEVIETDKSNVSAYFNLGNCYYEIKKYGKAIWAYERVLKYSPRDSEAPASIELCYKKLNSDQKWVAHNNGIQRLIYGIGSNTWSFLAIIMSVFMGISIFVLIVQNNNSWRRIHLMFLITEIVLITGFIIAAKSSENHLSIENFGVITQKSIPTYLNYKGEKSTIQLTEGTKIEILNTFRLMHEVMLFDGKTALVSTEDIEMI
jgi:tetratricopeptide (TPR) repeat protein